MSRLANRGWGDYWYCTGKRKDGEPCGRKVGTSHGRCWQHRPKPRRVQDATSDANTPGKAS